MAAKVRAVIDQDIMQTIRFKLNGAEGWSIRMMGPDTDFDLVGDTNDGDIAIPENGVYDPTNGTVSNGDIIRSGGGIVLVSE